jgi:glycosyltransferase involved in cell wall biosynthesis
MSAETVALIHNYYQQPGGEDQVFAAEGQLLEQHGHRVARYIAHNDAIVGMNRLALARATIWNSAEQHKLRAFLRHEGVRLAHFHNTFPLISPAAYTTCRELGVPVVQTLHNYRLICPNALLLRAKGICHDCVGKTLAWPGVLHACYRNSRLQSAGVAAMLAVHRWRGTWQQQVDCYIALSDFSRQQLIAGGLPADKIVVKPNFLLSDPGPKSDTGTYALFVGRLSEEKGVRTLLHAWRNIGAVPLKVVGDGPLMNEATAYVGQHNLTHVELLGRQPHAAVVDLLKQARLLVFPSTCYENFSITLLEAFACAVPVVASGLGSIAEMIDDEQTGLHAAPGNAEALAERVRWLWERPDVARRLGREARATFEARYTAAQNYRMLRDIYERVTTS